MSYTLKQHQILMLILSVIIIISVAYLRINYSALNTSDVYKNFLSNSVITVIQATPNSSIVNTLHSNATWISEFHNLTLNPQLFAVALGSTKSFSDTKLNTGFGLLMQIILGVSATLLGLYTLLFVESIKLIFKCKSKHEFIKYFTILFVILPLPFLTASLFNFYTSFIVYQNLSGSVASY